MSDSQLEDEKRDADEAIAAFEQQVGVAGLRSEIVPAGNRVFLKFIVGRESPLYTHALHQSQKTLSSSNCFKGAVGVRTENAISFPQSLESRVLLTLLARSTREVSEHDRGLGFAVPCIPFQRREDHTLAQAASHIVRGRRGVGKSTLMRRAVELLRATPALVAVLDMQAYSTLSGNDLLSEVLYDACAQFLEKLPGISNTIGKSLPAEELMSVSSRILDRSLPPRSAPPIIKRALRAITCVTAHPVYVFLDDYHLVCHEAQPLLLHLLHGALKGANGWIKVAGLSSLLNTFSASSREGLQVPGDAQILSLDLTLENPEAAESHLRAILESFLKAVGYSISGAVVPESAFRRLAWATAGVPRDFLQMFARSVEHAERNKHNVVTLSDVNIAIGEFGQQKMDDLLKDARNEADGLKDFLSRIQNLCLDQHKVNAFLVRSEDSHERTLVHALSDLRLVHLIHQSITPNRAGERYEAYIIDYSIFTGFRRRPGVREMVPVDPQFKASELRALPRIEKGFLGNAP